MRISELWMLAMVLVAVGLLACQPTKNGKGAKENTTVADDVKAGKAKADDAKANVAGGEGIVSKLEETAAIDMSTLVGANNAFALEILRETQSEGNVFYSPYSIVTALSMTAIGARAETARQMWKTLKLAGKAKNLEALVEQWQGGLKTADDSPAQLKIANALWIEQGYSVLEAFKQTLKVHFGANAQNAAFGADPEGERKRINQWVAGQTNDLIRDLLPKGVIMPTTKLVLVNALYFKAEWRKHFGGKTFKDDFRLADGTAMETDFMYKKHRTSYYEDEVLQAIRKDYVGEQAMVILLPKDVAGLAKVEASLDGKRWQAINDGLKAEVTKITLPKFKMRTHLSLKSILSAWMPDAFSFGLADFSGMTGNKDLAISAVEHAAFVAVDTKGTEAAAATAVAMAVRSLPMRPNREPKVFKADHPFIFAIVDKPTGTILCLGRYVKPSL